MENKRIRFAALLCAAALCVPMTSCGKKDEEKPAVQIQGTDLSKDIQPQNVNGMEISETFCEGQTAFALNLMQQSMKENRSNVLVSPYSIVQALGMTANGAKGETLAQMEQTIGGVPVQDLNGYLLTQRKNQPDDEFCRLLTANSVWLRDEKDRLSVQQSFLQTLTDYYNAEAFKAPFDESTLKDINSWVDKNTEHMIPQILDEIKEETVMYLINAVTFDGKWAVKYDTEPCDYEFTSSDGRIQTAQMMFSDESRYLSDDHAEGFLKYYQGGKYAFAALMPEENLSVYDYTASLTPASLRSVLKNAENTTVTAGLPQFSYDYGAELSETLKAMGMTAAFDPEAADLSAMGTSANGNMYIGRVIHKTHIDVDTEGTKAAAATVVEVNDECAAEDPVERKTVILDRPFLYMILDTENNLPVFMGILTEIPQ